MAAVSMMEGVVAVEHPVLSSTADFKETWNNEPKKDDLITLEKELRYTKFFDHSKRPVIGVLTEPLRGELYTADRREEIGSGVDRKAGYVPRAHVQFLEQAGVRVVPVDYRLSRDELVALFD